MIAIELDDVSRSFEMPDGRTYRAIVGPSGCGKSTLLNIVAGLLQPTSGRVRVLGDSLEGLNRRATYMFQQDALLPWKNVRDNVALGLTLAGEARDAAHRRADEWLARVGLAAFARHFPSQLSGGMRKRVAMAQNWIIDRDILLMDEPFSALDIHTRQHMEAELLELWEGSSRGSDRDRGARKTIVFVTHDLEEAIALADEVARPRDLLDLRTQPAFVELYRTIWADLRQEVIRSQRGTEAPHG